MIRPLCATDRQLFLTLMDEFYHSDAVLHPTPAAYHINTFEEIMRSDRYLLAYILEHDNKTAGYALLSRSFSPEVGGTVIWIEEIYIRENFRSQGLGSEFFDWLEKEIPAARYRLEIEPDNQRAAELYRRRGYKNLAYTQMVKDTGLKA